MKILVHITCCRCGIEFGLTEEFHSVARQSEDLWFHCPNGHRQHFPLGESDTDKLRRERDQLRQRMAQWEDEVAEQRKRRAAAERRVSAARGQITKLKKRASNGVCPCCNRTFADLQRHMATKHPAFTTEPDATEHVH